MPLHKSIAEKITAMPASVVRFWEKKRNQFDEKNSEFASWLSHGLESGQEPFDAIRLAWGGSDFVANWCAKKPLQFKQLIESGDLLRVFERQDYVNQIADALADCSEEHELSQRLREFRNRQMTRIIWRDFTRLADMEETTRDVTWLAEVAVNASIERLFQGLSEVWGEPKDREGNPQSLVVLAMGKMGAWELNVSSDIDLIFAYPESGETQGGRKQCSNQEFFIKLGQRLIKLLDERTAEGFVFRVDMRLRPYGKSGPLVMNFDAMEQYYQQQGRDWERYAMIKARVVAGDSAAGRELMALLRPFTYRKYIDYSAFDALREMKEMIRRELHRTGKTGDVKKGQGGIREVEFVAQAFQIIRGGRDLNLQITPLKTVLEILRDDQQLPAEDTQSLYGSYVFLRNVEHVLQGWMDQQTQTLPADEEMRERVAWLMDCPDWSAFISEYERHTADVHRVFNSVIAPSESAKDSEGQAESATHDWLHASPEHLLEFLAEFAFNEAEVVASHIGELAASKTVAALPDESRKRLTRFLPRLIESCAEADNSAETFGRALKLVYAVLRRSAYLVLLLENPAALTRLIKLCSASPWISEQLARHPALLDELLDERSLFTSLDKQALVDELRQQLLRVPEEDLESQMEVIRYFKLAHGLRIAACEVTDVLPLMKVSDALTWLAEAILDHVLDIAWDYMVARAGEPGFREGENPPGIAIVGYGKMGGIELGHGSDLDLVFLHDADPMLNTTGEKSIDNGTFFARVGQRIIHILTARTPSGDVYEVDMRLRPSGNSGLLVSSLNAFEKYQAEQAWTWEHQALVRARFVSGSSRVGDAFRQVRERILAKSREAAALAAEVVQMRNKMRAHLGTKPSPAEAGQNGEVRTFNIKQDPGGIVDIEFIVQYLVLAYGSEFSDLLEYTDNIRILEAIQRSGLLTEEQAQCLIESYIHFRSLGHSLCLQGVENEISADRDVDIRNKVSAIWREVFAEQETTG
ncbi:MAG: bifunctional [glutamate--ammonia ligase]-adenylyl-L-tyrosine phosphorylase/[glutamate--ammonia-ligase] adenylyltransferase [bacterium]